MIKRKDLREPDNPGRATVTASAPTQAPTPIPAPPSLNASSSPIYTSHHSPDLGYWHYLTYIWVLFRAFVCEIHEVPTDPPPTPPWTPHGHPRIPHAHPMDTLWTPWLTVSSSVFVMNCDMASHGTLFYKRSTDTPRTSHMGLPTSFPRATHGIPMGSSRTPHRTTYPQGLSTNTLWTPHGHPISSTWDDGGCPRTPHGHPTDTPPKSHGHPTHTS